MNSPTLSVDLDRAGRHLTVYVSGEVDAATAPVLVDTVINNHQPDDEIVWLDMAEVTFCDSSGIAAIANLDRYVEAAGGRLTVYDPSPLVLRVMTICGLDKVVRIWSQPASADTRRVAVSD